MFLAADPEGRLHFFLTQNRYSPDPWKVALLFVPRLRLPPCWYRAVAFLPNRTARGQQVLQRCLSFHIEFHPNVCSHLSGFYTCKLEPTRFLVFIFLVQS